MALQNSNLLETRFDRLEGRFDKLENRFGNLENRFGRLEAKFDEFIDFTVAHFAKIDSRFEQIDNRFEKVDERLSKLENGQDHILGEIRELRLENTVSAHRSHRIESWVIRASKKINLPYHP